MKQFNGFEAKRSGGQEALPAGGYVAKIIGAKEKKYDWGSVLEIGFDVCEGEYKGFFDTQYKAAGDGAKWKGILRQRVPDEDNQYFEGQKRSFNNTMWAIEESNTGYHWDWDETKLKGKTVGVLFRNYEYDIEGSLGAYTDQSSSVNAFVNWSGSTEVLHMDCGNAMQFGGPGNSPEEQILGMAKQGNEDNFLLLSPSGYLDKDDVAGYIFHGDQDFVVASCVNQYLYEQMQKYGVESYIHHEPQGGHGMGMYSEENLKKMTDFLDAQRAKLAK